MRIGVDVGGTNTDAVLMRGDTVVARVKRPTTADVSDGIEAAIRAILAQSGTGTGAIGAVMIGTTHFTNALVERRRLSRVGVIRIGYPATTAIPPLYGWPPALARAVLGERVIVGGGLEFSGRPIAPFDEAAVARAAHSFREAGLEAVAISSVFAPVDSEPERRAAAIVREICPGMPVTLSSAFGRLGLLERENAAVMNAALLPLARRVVASFGAALRRLAIGAPFFISQNDGTLMGAAFAAEHPALTFASGPTNSMRGAARLSGATDAVVIDIGGTTADIGCLQGGFPRESALAVDIGGVRTNLRMPDLVSIGLGGGSIVRAVGDGVTIGPDSVGYDITRRALVFGGDTLTATDIAVASGHAALGDASLVAGLPRALLAGARAQIRGMLEDGIDRMKLSQGDVPVILVGGGSLLVADRLAGATQIIVPPDHDVANAVGAAIAQTSGEVDRCYGYAEWGRQAALDDARRLATEGAVAAGADPATVEIVELEELPLAYLAGGTTRVRVRAIGDLLLAGAPA